jgi:predicted nucleic acid-binding protein
MARDLFVDTGAWVALADEDDQFHERAESVYPGLLRDHQRLVTTNLVLAESYIILRLALGHAAAMAFLDNLRASPRIERAYITADVETDAVDILRRYRDQTFSLTDASSFALMHRRGMPAAFAFDAHFATAGYVCLPGAT